MKNLFLLHTQKPTRLHFDHTGFYFSENNQLSTTINSIVKGINIYITNLEKIKAGDWYTNGKNIFLCADLLDVDEKRYDYLKKIILTTNPKLIADGVQAIDDTFLEWFVKNPSCEEVEVKKLPSINGWIFTLIIPQKEQSVQEYEQQGLEKHSFELEEQDKNKYSDEEVLFLLENYDREFKLYTFAYTKPCSFTVKEWFKKNSKSK